MSDEKTTSEPTGASGGSLAKPSGVAAAWAAAADIGCAMQAVEGFPTKQLQWEMVGKDTDGTPIYRNNWGEYRRWIPVTERLPANRQRVIAFFPSETESVGEATFRNDEENRWLTEHGSWFDATHWMPLPAPPLYRQPQPALTDAEREAVEWYASFPNGIHAATLRGLLERLGGGR